jgi:hypothetical protein
MVLRAETKEDFSLLFRRRRNFSSLSARETSFVNGDLFIQWEFDFKSDSLLGQQLLQFVHSPFEKLKRGLNGGRRVHAHPSSCERLYGKSAAPASKEI